MANTMSSRFFPVQAVHLGQLGSIASFNYATLPFDIPQAPGSTSTFGIGGGLGAVIEDSGKVYRLVQRSNTSDVATSAGFVAYWKTRASAVVTSKASEQEGGVNSVAGAFLGIITNGNYCFVQIGGLQTVGVDSNSAVAGSLLQGGGGSDGQFKYIAAGSITNPVYAVAWGSASSNLVAAYWILGANL